MQHKIFGVREFIKTESATAVQRAFHLRSNIQPPTRKSICHWNHQFEFQITELQNWVHLFESRYTKNKLCTKLAVFTRTFAPSSPTLLFLQACPFHFIWALSSLLFHNNSLQARSELMLTPIFWCRHQQITFAFPSHKSNEWNAKKKMANSTFFALIR
jgi:hypothetical protein